MLRGSTGIIQQFFSDHIIKCRLDPIAQLDALGSVALLNPYLVHFSNAHRLTLVSIMMPHNRCTAESRFDPAYLLLDAGFTVAQNKPLKSSDSSSLGV